MRKNRPPQTPRASSSRGDCPGRGRTDDYLALAILLVSLAAALVIVRACAFYGDIVTSPLAPAAGPAYGNWSVVPIPEEAEVFLRMPGDQDKLYRINQ